ncbi:MAG: hypothetical protein L0Z62_21425, partial [Gemmataceae bacterium]|nr:hypothetical protein [Gemmataceae bacterium]
AYSCAALARWWTFDTPEYAAFSHPAIHNIRSYPIMTAFEASQLGLMELNGSSCPRRWLKMSPDWYSGSTDSEQEDSGDSA